MVLEYQAIIGEKLTGGSTNRFSDGSYADPSHELENQARNQQDQDNIRRHFPR